MSGRILLHYKGHTERLARWAVMSAVLLLLAGVLCGFSQNDGVIPVNKNLWSTSFALVTAGGGLVVLSGCYVLVDVLQYWSGAPFIYLGMNSILIYCGHGILQDYMPFSYIIFHPTHGNLLKTNVLGTVCWIAIAFYLYKIKFFVKI